MKKIFSVFSLIFILILSGCTQNHFKSYSDVYENGTTIQQLEYVTQNGLLEKVGFASFSFSNGTSGWKIDDAKNEVSISYFFSCDEELVGSIESKILDYNLEVRIAADKYKICLRGTDFSYRCPLSITDMTLMDSLEYGTDYYMIFEVKGVSVDDVKDLLSLYSQLTDRYLSELYINCQ